MSGSIPIGARVLVVDDDASIRRTIATALGRAGFAVTTAEEAVPAMQLLDTFELVVADYNMLTASGADVVRHFKQRFGDQVYCVILSGEDDDSVSLRCKAAGADAVMVKPTLPTDLRRCLAQGLDVIRAAA